MSKREIFEKKNVLVTGGAGFIGSHLCDELIKDSQVICIDNFSTGNEKNIDHLLSDSNFEFIKHDVTEPVNLEEFPELQKFKIEFQGIQEIYHLACPTSPKNFEHNIIPTIMANSYGIKNVLDLAVKYDSKFLHFSTAVIYGPRREGNDRIPENDIGLVDLLSARSSYDEGKRFAETVVKNFADKYNINAKIMRLFRTYGPRMKLNDGQMIPDFINSALDNKDIIIYGDENFSSSFCYVSDVIDAARAIMEADINGPVNIGSDIDIKAEDLARKILDMTGSNSEIKYTNEHFFITPLCLPDIARARNELGWMPIVNLDKGLEKTIEDLKVSRALKGVEHAL